MRTSEELQMLTTGIVNLNNVRIPPESIDWSMYNANPVLLYDKSNEGHYGVVVGQVLNIQRRGDGWAGNLSFMENFEDADIAFEKYNQGVLKFTSTGGFAVGAEDEEGVFVTEKYVIRENSLVKFPANMEAMKVNADTELDDEAKEVYEMLSTENPSKELRYVTLSHNLTIEGEEQNADQTETPEGEEQNADQTETPEGEEQNADQTETPEGEEQNADQTETPEGEEQNASSVTETNGDVIVPNNTGGAPQPPNGMTWHEQNHSQTAKRIMSKNYRDLCCDAEFQKGLGALSQAFMTGAKKADLTPENAQISQVLAQALYEDYNMHIMARQMNVTNEVGKTTNVLNRLLECAAGPAADATLSAADLGVIKYMNMVYRQLFPKNTFARSIRFVPMEDRTGAIFVQSNINPPTYMGTVTPLNVPNYLYDDIKRSIARRVFTFAPILFQHADLAVLNYDKEGIGMSEAMQKVIRDIHTWWLSVIGNTANIPVIGTTGEVYNTTGYFPIEAPLSNLDVHALTLPDIGRLQGVYMMQNYDLDVKRVELVLPTRLYTDFTTDREVRDKLIKFIEGNPAGDIRFDQTWITQRNPTLRYNTATPGAEIDPAMFTDNLTADDGTFTPTTAATTTADHLGAGVSFVEGEVVAGLGTIELISVPDPNNYGHKISGWCSSGVTPARVNGVGTALVVPTIETP